MRFAEHVRSIVDADGSVLLDHRTGKFFSVNRIGTQICSLLRSGITKDLLINEIQKMYEIEPATARGDVETFIGHLRERGFLYDGDSQ